jgi:thioredoxin 1
MEKPQFTVNCLCALWCDTCSAYKDGFLKLAERYPQARFTWLDVEDDAEEIGDLDVENFPTIQVKRGDEQLFYGVMLPYPEHLSRLLSELLKN